MDKVTQSMVSVLVRAYQSGKDKLPTSQAARYFTEQCGFGSIIGSNWLLEARDRRAIRAYLVGHHGIADPDTVDFRFAGKSRVEAAGITPEEKFANAGPHDGFVLVRALNGGVRLNGLCLATLGRSFQYVDAREVVSIEHDCVLVVENFEAIKCAQHLVLVDFPYSDPLLVFRGDAAFPANGARLLCEGAQVPVVAWTDLDPQGVNIAAAVPQVQGAIFPSAYDALSRADLYDKQRHLFKAEEEYPPGWRLPLAAMRQARRCLTQEVMIARRMPCRLYACTDASDDRDRRPLPSRITSV